MISGASEEELDLANIRADIILATSIEHLQAVDDYYDKEIERLNNIIDELEKWLISDIKMFEKLKEDSDEEYHLGRITTAKKVLAYFEKEKELKDSDK